MLAKYMKSSGKKLELPISEQCTLGFVHWLAFERKLKASSISGYLAGIKKLHILKGAGAPEIRTELVNMVLEGKKNMDVAERMKHGQGERQPVTMDMMKLLKAQIRNWDAQQRDKLTLWLVCSLLFHAACRGGELLCRLTDRFDPAVDFLRQDMHLTGEVGTGQTLQLRLKSPKVSKDKRAVIVDVFRSDTQICPVKAYLKWSAATTGDEDDQPAFRWSNGKPVTPSSANRLIKQFLDEYIPGHNISLHSFRTGAASMMAQLGFSDKDIKAVGRWSSKAFENYIKLPRTKRLQTLHKIKNARLWE